jgi:hypothetical protein
MVTSVSKKRLGLDHGLFGNYPPRRGNVRMADQPPRTRSAAPDPTRLKASLATPGWNKGFGSRHVGGDYNPRAFIRTYPDLTRFPDSRLFANVEWIGNPSCLSQ